MMFQVVPYDEARSQEDPCGQRGRRAARRQDAPAARAWKSLLEKPFRMNYSKSFLRNFAVRWELEKSFQYLQIWVVSQSRNAYF